jgi:hypothetical protein
MVEARKAKRPQEVEPRKAKERERKVFQRRKMPKRSRQKQKRLGKKMRQKLVAKRKLLHRNRFLSHTPKRPRMIQKQRWHQTWPSLHSASGKD